ncbi:MAG: FAD-dependent oxidoreductase, partial [Clostridia bacterium]
MHICGADDHMARANARETGIIEEIQLLNKHRNPTNSYAIFDTVLWEIAKQQPQLTLYLNTTMDAAQVQNGHVTSVSCYQQTTETRLALFAKLFVDATGDGLLAALAGVPFQVGREAKSTYGESYAPEAADHYTMGNSLMFKARHTGHPVPFVCPDWAYRYSEEDLLNRGHGDATSGYWWVELGGGKLDVTEDYELLRDELQKTVYGIWDHIKNSGEHQADDLELEWMGCLPGKRESRRFVGEYVLTQMDCQNGRRFTDAVAYGGWPMDVHTVEGFLNGGSEPTIWIHLKDVYTIPYGCYYSQKVDNLYFCGRVISASHMAFASARVMATCAVGGQAVGTAAAMAVHKQCTPHALCKHINELQQALLRDDCWLPGIERKDEQDIAPLCKAEASHTLMGYDVQNLLHGASRRIDDASNAWAGEVAKLPTVTLTLPEKMNVRTVSLLFDSNLSREITISINQEVLGRQVQGTPPELVRDFTLLYLENGQEVGRQHVKQNWRRRCVIENESPIGCDQLQLLEFTTHGSSKIVIYEVRI